MAVGPERGYKKEYCHSGKQEGTGSEIIVLIPKEKVHHHHCHIGKPEQVRDDEHFAERNVVIKGYVNDSVVICDCTLEMAKPCQIYDAVDDQWQRMSVFLYNRNE
jgi:hypothetical protein